MQPLLPPSPAPNSGSGSSTSRDELAWDAFRYTSDAMTPRETLRFESRLGRDQEAREALAAAVDTVGALSIVVHDLQNNSAQPMPAVSGRSRRTRWVLVANGIASAAAILFLIVGLRSALRPGTISGAVDVALAWTDLRGEAATSDLTLNDPVAVESPGSVIAGLGENDDPSGFDLSAEQPLPSWMLAAVMPVAHPEDLPQPEGR